MLGRAKNYLVALLVTLFYWAYSRLWRVRWVNEPTGKGPRLYAHWHGDELLLVGACAWRGRMAVMSSWSRDGLIMKRVLQWLGYRVVRGSSSRGGGAGLKGLIDAVRKEGFDASLAVDGPRGPRFRVKRGIIMLARETGCDIVPGAASSSRRFVFNNAWNRCYLPLPLSRCVVICGEPLRVPPGATDEEMESLRVELERRLSELKTEAESRFLTGPQLTDHAPAPAHD